MNDMRAKVAMLCLRSCKPNSFAHQTTLSLVQALVHKPPSYSFHRRNLMNRRAPWLLMLRFFVSVSQFFLGLLLLVCHEDKDGCCNRQSPMLAGEQRS